MKTTIQSLFLLSIVIMLLYGCTPASTQNQPTNPLLSPSYTSLTLTSTLIPPSITPTDTLLPTETYTLTASGTTTDTPVPTVSPTPSTTALPEGVFFRDDFESISNERNDYLIRWDYWDKKYPKQFFQEEGILNINASADTALIGKKYKDLVIQKPTYFEAKIMLESATDGAIALKLFGQLSGSNYWGTQCGIYGPLPVTPKKTWVFCGQEYKGERSNNINKPNKLLDFGTWQTVKIEFNPENSTVIYYINGVPIGKVIEPGIFNAKFSVVISSYGSNTKAKVEYIEYGYVK